MRAAITGAAALLFTGLTACADPAAPTWQDAAEATYPGVYPGKAALESGRYEGPPFAPGAASRPRLALMPDFIRSGDLDGDGRDESLVLLVADGGGSGSFHYLAVLGRAAGGVEPLAVAPLGDRIQVVSGDIRPEIVALRVVQAGHGDPACCPGEVVERSFLWRDGALTEGPVGSPVRLSPAELAGRSWTLRRLDGESVAALDPAVTLSVAGSEAGGQSGCNDYRGTVAAGAAAGEIRFEVLTTTRRRCPELAAGIEQRYLAALGATTRFRFEATRLVLVDGDGGTGRLEFD